MTGEKCVHGKGTESRCKNWPLKGGAVCRSHGGNAPQVKAKAAVRAELMAWGLDAPTVDPGETLLKLVSQSAARAQRYSALVEEAYEAAERLRTAHAAGELLITQDGYSLDEDGREESAGAQQAREDLDRIFTTGGVSALIGNTYAASATGSVYATGEAIRGLVTLEAQERERCANWCVKAIAAGLAERTVRLAERQGALIADLLRAVMNDPQLALTSDQRRALPDVAERHLDLVC